MSTLSSDVISQIVQSARLRHICTALTAMVVGEEESFSHFAGDLGAGFFWAIDAIGTSHALAWNEAGVVALVSEAISTLRPEKCFEDSPASFRELVSRVIMHEYAGELSTAGFWLTSEAPSIDRVFGDERLRSLRGYLCQNEAAIYGNNDGWKGWETVMPVPKEFARFAIEFERASRAGSYEISTEEGEELIPLSWFRPPSEARTLPTANVGRPAGDLITLENVALTVKKLAEVGISWKSAIDVAKTRGVTQSEADSEAGSNWRSTLNISTQGDRDD